MSNTEVSAERVIEELQGIIAKQALEMAVLRAQTPRVATVDAPEEEVPGVGTG